MIDLLASDERTAFGLMAALDAERTPFRRLASPAEVAGRVVILTGANLGVEAAALVDDRSVIMIGDCGAASHAFADTVTTTPWAGPVTIGLDGAIWPPNVRALAAEHGCESLRLPWARGVLPSEPLVGEVLATCTTPDGRVHPAVVARGHVVWVLVDVGSALASLMDESYRVPVVELGHPIPRAALRAYYAAPEFVRGLVQRRAYRRLAATLPAQACPSAYPVDGAGWLLTELFAAVLRRVAGVRVRLHRWPAPFDAAAALTHDLEPSRFTYRRGVRLLRRRVAALGHPPTYGVVARSAPLLAADDRAAIAAGEIVCHGLEHRGETVLGTRDDIAAGLARARAELADVLGRPVDGFRSPRLDRSSDLLWALDRVGFTHDSSFPDVDRENLTGFGGGVRLNVPYRPPIDDGGRVRPSRCLELPVSAPDCVQPLFEGQSVHALRRAVRQKIEFLVATGGLYVGIVHAGVFGMRDVARRGAHLAFVRRLLRRPAVWTTSLREVWRWWCVREQVTLTVADGQVRVTNLGAASAERLRIVVETAMGDRVHAVPSLQPGETFTMAMDGSAFGRAGAA